MAFYAAIGPAKFFNTLVPLALLASLFVAGFIAHENEKPAPYWSCVGSVVIFVFFALPLLVFRPSEARLIIFGPSEARLIIFACFFSIGGYLSYSAIRHGHWTTRILALLVMMAYVLSFFAIIQNAIRN